MSIVKFPRRATLHGEWRPDEWQQLVALFLPNAATVGITWDVGSTERSDPQFYLLGPGSDRDCVLCVSRLAQGYVLEDGAGRLIGEAPSLDQLAEQTARAAVRGGRSFIARVAGGCVSACKFDPMRRGIGVQL